MEACELRTLRRRYRGSDGARTNNRYGSGHHTSAHTPGGRDEPDVQFLLPFAKYFFKASARKAKMSSIFRLTNSGWTIQSHGTE